MNLATLNRDFRLLVTWVLVFVPIFAAVHAAAKPPVSDVTTSSSSWTLVWNDEFDGVNNSPPDPSKWIVDIGGGGWGNKELEYYTARPENVRQESGNLVIRAIKEKFTGSDGVGWEYTSARIKTEGRFSQKYGRFEARIQIPSEQGVWPAFWMLGDDFPTAGWPSCGEIDIMEAFGVDEKSIKGSLHGPGYSATNPVSATYSLRKGQFSDGFHVFAVEWEPQVVRFYVDDELYATRTPADLPAGTRWVYDHPFFILLNLAVGGNPPGNPDRSTVFPQQMLVDYVRVYSRK
jgi:beta-glucanase (GH16 family)